MSRLNITAPNAAQQVVEGLYRDVERRIIASPPGLCPVDLSLAFLRLCHAQTCGKCVPCRVGLGTLAQLLENVLDGNASLEDIDLIERTVPSVLKPPTWSCGASSVSGMTMWNISPMAAACCT